MIRHPAVGVAPRLRSRYLRAGAARNPAASVRQAFVGENAKTSGQAGKEAHAPRMCHPERDPERKRGGAEGSVPVTGTEAAAMSFSERSAPDRRSASQEPR